MGSNDGLPAERPEHVVILDAYVIDRYEVSLQLYRKFLQAARYDAPPTWDDEAAETVSDRPAVGMSWEDAAAYCAWAGSDSRRKLNGRRLRVEPMAVGTRGAPCSRSWTLPTTIAACG